MRSPLSLDAAGVLDAATQNNNNITQRQRTATCHLHRKEQQQTTRADVTHALSNYS